MRFICFTLPAHASNCPVATAAHQLRAFRVHNRNHTQTPNITTLNPCCIIFTVKRHEDNAGAHAGEGFEHELDLKGG